MSCHLEVMRGVSCFHGLGEGEGYVGGTVGMAYPEQRDGAHDALVFGRGERGVGRLEDLRGFVVVGRGEL